MKKREKEREKKKKKKKMKICYLCQFHGQVNDWEKRDRLGEREKERNSVRE